MLTYRLENTVEMLSIGSDGRRGSKICESEFDLLEWNGKKKTKSKQKNLNKINKILSRSSSESEFLRFNGNKISVESSLDSFETVSNV